MKQINFQFHARREEILIFLYKIAMENNLYIISAELFPNFNYNVLGEMKEILDDINSSMFILSKNKPILSFTDYDDFCNKNKENLIIRSGIEKNNRIKESSIGCLAENDVDLLWKKIISNYKKKMLKGAWGVNPMNGNRNYYNNHYYTEAIKNAYEEGYELCACASNCIFQIIV